MVSKKITIASLIIAQLILVIASCTKTTTVLIDNSPAVTKTVSFAKDIQPIFSKSCALSGCHNGSIAPNLTDAVTAYASLQSGSFINTATPESSLVYLWLTGKEAITMPAGAANNPSNINGLMLAWIKQGAKNN